MGTELFIKTTLASQAAFQFVALFSPGDTDGDIEDQELEALWAALVAAGVTVDPNSLPGDTNGDGELSIAEVTAGLLVVWEPYCAEEMKEMLDGVILSRIPGYNVPYIATPDDADDADTDE